MNNLDVLEVQACGHDLVRSIDNVRSHRPGVCFPISGDVLAARRYLSLIPYPGRPIWSLTGVGRWQR